MLVLVLKVMLFLFGVSFISFISGYKIFTQKVKDNMKLSHYVACMAASLFLFSFITLILCFICSGIVEKFCLLFFGLSPFIIGHYATYKNRILYTIFQNVCVLFSIICVWCW